jgi:hypothetical protein
MLGVGCWVLGGRAIQKVISDLETLNIQCTSGTVLILLNSLIWEKSGIA